MLEIRCNDEDTTNNVVSLVISHNAAILNNLRRVPILTGVRRVPILTGVRRVPILTGVRRVPISLLLLLSPNILHHFPAPVITIFTLFAASDTLLIPPLQPQ